MYKECVKCGTPKVSKFYGNIWLSGDGLCSVCNAKYKERSRSKPIFEFTLIKEGSNKHLDSTGVRPSRKRAFIAKHNKKAIVAGQIFEELEKKKVRKLDDYI